MGNKSVGPEVPIHIAWVLMWVAAIGGLAFLIVHAIYVGFVAKPEAFVEPQGLSRLAGPDPGKVKRHRLAARVFHWIMAAAMFALLFTAFLPKVGVEFAWVTWHWIAGLVLTVSILFHIIHATFCDGLLVHLAGPAPTSQDAKNRARSS